MSWSLRRRGKPTSLNEVRPRRPEQYVVYAYSKSDGKVSMKSGLEGRNNSRERGGSRGGDSRLDEVRPRRPEQLSVELPNGVGAVNASQ
mgnify:CR=1 FL=1